MPTHAERPETGRAPADAGRERRRTEHRSAGGRAPRAEGERPGAPAAASPAAEAERVRLANRTALLTFATAALVIAALVALPGAVSAGTSPLGRAAAAALAIAAGAGVLAVWRSRVALRAARGPARPGEV